ncbi:MAG TPA: hypothetical protein VGW75_07695 [Solirubrobacteraceae bacterium]|jgi:hypothetical protein|nr:hypothetical protein [Solirubrobacteraceae bacterium]
MPPTVRFATPVADRRAGGYDDFANALARGRPFRQPVLTPPDGAGFSAGLELFLSSAGDVAALAAVLDGTLTWRAGTAEAPGDRLVLEVAADVAGRPRGVGRVRGTGLGALALVEGPPRVVEYENVDAAAVAAALHDLIAAAYAAAQADPRHPARWHPVMSARVGRRTLKRHLDGRRATADAEITRLTTAFTAGAGAQLAAVPVLAGDRIGRAAAYLTADPLPAAPPFPLGAADDPARARRLTLIVRDAAGTPLDPLHHLHALLAEALVPAATATVEVLTDVLDAGATALAHPLVTLLPELAGADRPPARRPVGGVTPLPLGPLNAFHGFPPAAPVSQLEWRYDDAAAFEARRRRPRPVVAVPALGTTIAATDRVTTIWQRHGAAIVDVCDRLQLPCELAVSLLAVESTADLDERIARFEPLTATDRTRLPAALETAYDRMVGPRATVDAAVPLGPASWRLDVTLDGTRTWPENALAQRGRLVAWDGARPRVIANTGGASTSAYTITVAGVGPPAPAEIWVLDGHTTSVPDPWNAAALVRPGASTLTWADAVTAATAGVRISVGVLQTLIETGASVVPWLDAVDPDVWADLGIPHPPAALGGYLQDWLVVARHSILLGVAYMRWAYNVQGTRFDLPVVGSAYNHGNPARRSGTRWGLQYHGQYVERAAPHLNAFRALFDGAAPPAPAPSVRLMR